MRTQSGRFLVVLVGVMLIAGCGVGTSRGTGGQKTLPERLVLWSANHETGDISEWLVGQSGAVFNTGSGSVTWTDDVAHGGGGALALSVTGASSSPQAARIFRWAENPVEATYGAWYLIPETVAPERWWNILQFKSRVGDTTKPTWVVNVGTGHNGLMYLYLFDAITGSSYTDVVSLPRPALEVDRWTHLEVYLLRASDMTGRIALWQDGRLLFDLSEVQTALGDNIQWSVNNYSDNLDPANVTIFVDDATIVTGRPEDLE